MLHMFSATLACRNPRFLGLFAVPWSESAKKRNGIDVVPFSPRTAPGEFGKSDTSTSLRYMRLFYLGYPRLLDHDLHHAARDESALAGRLHPIGAEIRRERQQVELDPS